MSDYPDYLSEVAVCMALQLDVAASPTSRT
jgi:hypothetical protein